MDDQENIKQLQQVDNRTGMIKKAGREEEWKQIHLEMEAGSSDIIPKRNYFLKTGQMALIMQGLREELKSQSDAVEEFERQDWDDEGEWVAQGWCEALEFAIKLIERHNRSSMADQ